MAGRSGIKRKVLGVARVGVAVGRRCSVGGPGRARGERGKQPTTERGVDIAVRTGAGARARSGPANSRRVWRRAEARAQYYSPIAANG